MLTTTSDDLDARLGQVRVHPAVLLLEDAGVSLVIVEPGQIVLAPYKRNVDRAAKVLAKAGATLRALDPSEVHYGGPTGAYLRRRRRTSWHVLGAALDLEFEPIAGLDYRTLLAHGWAGDTAGTLSAWACGVHREEIAELRTTLRRAHASRVAAAGATPRRASRRRGVTGR